MGKIESSSESIVEESGFGTASHELEGNGTETDTIEGRVDGGCGGGSRCGWGSGGHGYRSRCGGGTPTGIDGTIVQVGREGKARPRSKTRKTKLQTSFGLHHILLGMVVEYRPP